MEETMTRVSALMTNHKDLESKFKSFQSSKNSILESLDNFIIESKTYVETSPEEIGPILEKCEVTKHKILNRNMPDRGAPRQTRRCRYYNRGFCKFRDNCNFVHKTGICDKYLRNKICKMMICEKLIAP